MSSESPGGPPGGRPAFLFPIEPELLVGALPPVVSVLGTPVGGFKGAGAESKGAAHKDALIVRTNDYCAGSEAAEKEGIIGKGANNGCATGALAQNRVATCDGTEGVCSKGYCAPAAFFKTIR